MDAWSDQCEKETEGDGTKGLGCLSLVDSGAVGKGSLSYVRTRARALSCGSLPSVSSCLAEILPSPNPPPFFFVSGIPLALQRSPLDTSSECLQINDIRQRRNI